jgi:trigger factor
MKVDIEKREQSQVAIHISIPADHAQQEYNKACRRIGQRVNIPGFRRGKAPIKMIEKAVGQERIKLEALERLLPNVFADVISEHQLDVVAAPRILNYTYDLATGVDLEANADLRPEVAVPNLAITVEATRHDPPEGQLDEELQALRQRYARLEPAEGRPVGDADVVTIDFRGTLNGKAITGGSATGFKLDMAGNSLIDGFAEQILGHNAGEAFTIEVRFPEAYHDKHLAGQLAHFDITLHTIETRVTPELNDELAVRQGHASLDALKQSIQVKLDQKAQDIQLRYKHDAVVTALVKQLDVHIPPSMIDREAELMLSDMRRRFEQNGLAWQEFAKGDALDRIKAEVSQEARQRVLTSLLFSAVAKEASLSVEEAEFTAEVARLAQARGLDEATALKQLASSPDAVQAVADTILAGKVLAYLVEKATFTLVDPPAELVDGSAHLHDEHEHDHSNCDHDHHHDHAPATEFAPEAPPANEEAQTAS